MQKKMKGLYISLTVINFAFLCFLVFFNLKNHPRFWFDEGFNSIISRVVDEFSRYATYNGNEFFDFNFKISSGPVFILPSVILLKLGVPLILSVRIIAAIYWLLTIAILFFWLHKKSDNTILSLILIDIFALLTFDKARQFLGEYSALFFFLIALYLTFSSEKNDRSYIIFISGFLFGVSLLTKPILLISFPVIFAFIWLEKWDGIKYYLKLSKNKIRKSSLLIVGLVIPFIIWFSYIIVSLGIQGFWSYCIDYMKYYSSFNKPNITFISIWKKISSNNILFEQLVWILMIWIIGLIFCVRYKNRMILIILMINCIHLLEYIFIDIGWFRHYYFIGISMSVLTLGLCFESSNKNLMEITYEFLSDKKNKVIVTSFLVIWFGYYLSNSLVYKSRLLLAIAILMIMLSLTIVAFTFFDFNYKIQIKNLCLNANLMSLLRLALVVSLISTPIKNGKLVSNLNTNSNDELFQIVGVIDDNVNSSSIVFCYEHEINVLTKELNFIELNFINFKYYLNISNQPLYVVLGPFSIGHYLFTLEDINHINSMNYTVKNLFNGSIYYFYEVYN